MSVPDDPSSLFAGPDEGLLRVAVGMTILLADLIVLACSPALIIAVWRWAI